MRAATWLTTATIAFLACTLVNAPAAGAVQPEPAPPADARVVREVQGGGAQVYTCDMTAAGAFAWVLVGPRAVLVNEDGSDFGTHSAGPTWTAVDGSSIRADGAHPLVKIDHQQSVPSLLLQVTSSSGEGVLSGVRFVRRTDTEGGLAPPTGCDAAHMNDMRAIHYSAIYTFYR
jgi:hypothetical protein